MEAGTIWIMRAMLIEGISAETTFIPYKDALPFLNLHPAHGFIWDQEMMEG